MSAVYKKELRSFMTGMTGAIFVAILLLLIGVETVIYNLKNAYPYFEYALSSISYIFLFIIPILTMRSFSEEKRSKTDQLLYSLPITSTSVVMGKYLAMLTVFGVSMLFVSLYPLILTLYGSVSFITAYTSILAFFLLGAALIAICMFVSSLTSSQLISAIISVVVVFITYFMQSLSSYISSTSEATLIFFLILAALIGFIFFLATKNAPISLSVLAMLVAAVLIVYFIDKNNDSITIFANLVPTVLGTVSMFMRLNNFIYGIFDISALVYYLSIIALFVFFTVQSVERKRWN